MFLIGLVTSRRQKSSLSALSLSSTTGAGHASPPCKLNETPLSVTEAFTPGELFCSFRGCSHYLLLDLKIFSITPMCANRQGSEPLAWGPSSSPHRCCTDAVCSSKHGLHAAGSAGSMAMPSVHQMCASVLAQHICSDFSWVPWFRVKPPEPQQHSPKEAGDVPTAEHCNGYHGLLKIWRTCLTSWSGQWMSSRQGDPSTNCR